MVLVQPTCSAALSLSSPRPCMNAADINAARRLIAQFEDRALGRHNSSLHRDNPVAEQPAPVPEQPRHVYPKVNPDDCEVGDYLWTKPEWEGHPDSRILRVMKPIRPFLVSTINPEASLCDNGIMEFERVMLIRNGRRCKAWHRIA